MIGGKRITGNDIYQVIPRINWTANTEFDAYDHRLCSCNLFDTANLQFHVVTDEWNVYKCLSNNKGSLSTVKPTSTQTTGTSITADNYIWKFMYKISPAEQLKFTTDEYIPVKTLTGNDNSLQWQVQENAVPGSILAVKVENPGQNYTSATLTWEGDGTGFDASVSLDTSSNTVDSVIITSPGQDYTYLNITVSGNGTNAIVTAMISPSGGHGSDPLYELGGSYLMINPRIKGSEGGYLPVTNDYRQIAIISDIYERISGNLMSNTVFSQVMTIPVTGTSDTQFQKDETVYQGITYDTATFTATVLNWDASNNKLYLINTIGTPTQQVISGLTSGAQRFAVSGSALYPEVQKYSGKLLYTDNLPPISRAIDQTEDFKIVIRF